jgi:hypothetical protein
MTASGPPNSQKMQANSLSDFSILVLAFWTMDAVTVDIVYHSGTNLEASTQTGIDTLFGLFKSILITDRSD